MSIDAELESIVAAALKEDVGQGDITSRLTIPKQAQGTLAFVARQRLVACGTAVPHAVYAALGGSVRVTVRIEEGAYADNGMALAVAEGDACVLLTGERVALNLMQRMSGVATLTRQYVEAVKGTKAVILDTRKTMPGLRALDKYAVRTGGGQNHRMRLDDMVLIKDNHIALCGGVVGAIRKARAGTTLPVVVECDMLAQVREALAENPDRILLDNMPPDVLRQAVALSAGRIRLEASGGVTLASVRAIAETGVDYISVGGITHSAPAVDIGGDIKIR